ncbi:MAG TPA: rhomboid family intramembrane serine protease [Sphingobacteriaceae bacterium]
MSIINELKYKMLHSGSRLYLFIGINVLVFLVINLLAVFQFLFTRSTGYADWLQLNLSVPAYLPMLAAKFWTVITYMFGHRGLFHIFFNLLWLYWMGRIFEDFLNKRQFTFTYLAGGIAGAALYVLAYNVFPAFSSSVQHSVVIGASASVMAIVVATATLLPDYSITLLLFGSVRLKYLAIVFIIMDIVMITGSNAGGGITHIGGAILGYVYIKQLRRGNDWSKLFTRNRSRLRPIRNEAVPKRNINELPDQEVIDSILDKISKSGYDSLSKTEKEQLFKASKKQ